MKVLQWNLENFFINLDKYDHRTPLNELSDQEWSTMSIAREPNKALGKLLEIRDIFLELSPDVAVLSEVGTRLSLENFVQHFLPTYEVRLLNGRSRRGIDCGFLVKKDSPYTYEVTNLATTKLSRTVTQLSVSENQVLKTIVIGVHLKAKSSTEQDWFSLRQRDEEFTELSTIIKKLQLENPGLPVLVAGDFNGDLNTDWACNSLTTFVQDLRLTDLHQELQSTPETRCTFVRTDPRQLNQLDYIFWSKSWTEVIDLAQSFTYRYKTYYEIPLPFPETLAAKMKLPSDHYPTLITLKL